MRNYAKMIIVGAFLSGAALAADARVIMNGRPVPGCVKNESATISISFNGYDKDVAAVRDKLTGKIDEVKTLAKDQHFTKFDMQSYNYNINANYNNGMEGDSQYQYSGNANFTILPADKAVDFMVILTKKGYHANVSVNSYNNGNCNPAADGAESD